MLKIIGLFLSVSLAFLIVSCNTGTTTEQVAKATNYVTMPGGTAIVVALVDSIDTDVQISGQEFCASLTEPIVVNGYTLFPYGAEAKGILSRVVESGRLTTPAELDFSLTAIKDANGRWVDVATDMIMEKKGSHTDREVAMIGGGAIVGGIIGKIIDRDGSTEIGAVAGAAAGTGLSAATGKDDIFYGVGSVITFFSRETMQVARR